MQGSKFRGLFDAVAGIPAPTSYTWSGYRSPVTAIVVWLSSITRFLSPLQWLKFGYRAGRLQRPSRQRRQRSLSHLSGSNRRVDVPPALTDWYFIGVATLLGVTWYSHDWLGERGLDMVAAVLAWVFAVESISWIFYYFLLVRIGHVEDDFVIWSPAEYLLLFPLQILIQSLALAIITTGSLADSILLLVGQGTASDGPDLIAAVLSVAYLGILIAALLGSLRPMRTRQSQAWIILGYGDVVRRLIIPALDSIGVRSTQRRVLDVVPRGDLSPSRQDVLVIGDIQLDSIQEGTNQRHFIEKNNGIYIIASPTETHVRYLQLLHTYGRRGVCEKPFTLDARELELLKSQPSLVENVFCLAYYSLDKGLPLTYLLDSRPVYEPYLDLLSTPAVSTRHVMARLGDLHSVNISLAEPATPSPIPEDADRLRSLEDLVFHPFTFLAQLCGADAEIIQVSRCSLDHNSRLNMRMQVRSREHPLPIAVAIDVAQDPQVKTKHRALECTFEGGRLLADFDRKECSVFTDSEGPYWRAAVKDDFKPNYHAMFQMVHGWINKESSPRQFDRLAEQLWANTAWIRVRDQHFGTRRIPSR